MINYALLINPGHNRVYFNESIKLAQSELQAAFSKISAPCGEVSLKEIAGVSYVVFCARDRLVGNDLTVLSMLSFVYAVFELRYAKPDTVLVPIRKTNPTYMPASINTILKYTGKTNEQFTRMMINLAFLCSDFTHSDHITLLDPIAGKGTTLFEGLISGYDVYGIEIGEKVAGETVRFLKKYLETEKYKHTVKTEKISAPDKAFTAVRHSISLSRTKEEQRENKEKHFELIAGNSVYAERFFKKSQVHLIVGDLPYGVQHGNVTNEKQSSLTRNPKELLQACLPGWHRVLKNGGTMVLAWNQFVLPRSEFVSLLRSAGLFVFDDGIYRSFSHRVDQSINRDLVIAKKTVPERR